MSGHCDPFPAAQLSYMYHYLLCLSPRPACRSRIDRSRSPLGQSCFHHLPVDCLSSRRSVFARGTGNVPVVPYMKLSRYAGKAGNTALMVRRSSFERSVHCQAFPYRLSSYYSVLIRGSFSGFYKLFFIIFSSRRSPLLILS